MVQNPRNAVQTEEASNTGAKVDPSNWKTLSLGSLALKGSDGKLLREGAVSFTINDKNAEVIRDAAQYIMDNEKEKITISAGTFFDLEKMSKKVTGYYSHRLYISADSIAKFGKKISDYVKLG